MRKPALILLIILAVAFLVYTSETGIVNWSFIGLNVTPSVDPAVITTPVFPPVTSPFAIPSAIPSATPFATATPYVVFITNTQIITAIEPLAYPALQTPVPAWQPMVDYAFTRCLAGLFVLALIASAMLWYLQRNTQGRMILENERYHLQLREKELENERARIEAAAPKLRPIITNRPIATEVQKVITRRNVQIEKRRMIEFVTEALKQDGIGLVVSKWKNDRKWDQAIVEAILDYLSDLQLITPRQNGRACEWNDAYRPQDVLKQIADDQPPLPHENDTLQMAMSSV